MDSETRASITALSETMSAGVARMDRYFRLEHEVAQCVTMSREIAEIRLELRELRARSGQTDELRRAIAELAVRVDRLQRRQPD